ncbi:hypothetical protein SYJ56_24530 [Algoriphagus sp. D3-2-R+10]|uniref:hypothetical protein n=1 Tax=Algoriphagus aurantiacus TaxID=3103948 RepID=UPI002B3EB19D|nr:hypothetical protein [Algoriphagus sp. D3-2-R+10]MEB2778498.1 hypothetical protein [Algoriphagus sp. D3-2-R+10]
MSGAELLLSAAGAVTVMLLSVIAYFLKLLIEDTRQLSTELAKLKELFIRLEAEQALIKTVMQRTRSPPRRPASRREG